MNSSVLSTAERELASYLKLDLEGGQFHRFSNTPYDVHFQGNLLGSNKPINSVPSRKSGAWLPRLTCFAYVMMCYKHPNPVMKAVMGTIIQSEDDVRRAVHSFNEERVWEMFNLCIEKFMRMLRSGAIEIQHDYRQNEGDEQDRGTPQSIIESILTDALRRGTLGKAVIAGEQAAPSNTNKTPADAVADFGRNLAERLSKELGVKVGVDVMELGKGGGRTQEHVQDLSEEVEMRRYLHSKVNSDSDFTEEDADAMRRCIMDQVIKAYPLIMAGDSANMNERDVVMDDLTELFAGYDRIQYILKGHQLEGLAITTAIQLAHELEEDEQNEASSTIKKVLSYHRYHVNENRKLRARLNRAEQQLQEYRGRLQARNTRIDELNSRIEELNSFINGQEQRISGMNTAAERLVKSHNDQVEKLMSEQAATPPKTVYENAEAIILIHQLAGAVSDMNDAYGGDLASRMRAKLNPGTNEAVEPAIDILKALRQNMGRRALRDIVGGDLCNRVYKHVEAQARASAAPGSNGQAQAQSQSQNLSNAAVATPATPSNINGG